MKRFPIILAVSLLLALASPLFGQPRARAKADHIILIVWDGMRPDFVRPNYAPNLSRLAQQGVFFKNHHSAFISSTEVNGTVLATGVHPDRNGIMANSDYRPEIGWLGPTGTESVEAVRRGDLLTGGNYLQVPTIPEILQNAGIPTVVAGTKAVTILFDRSLKHSTAAGENSATLYKGRSIPSTLGPALTKANEKDFPPTVVHPNKDQDAWTTKSLIQVLWKKGLPKFSVLWLSEPDASQHETGPGSDVSHNAIESSDKNLGEVLKHLDEKKLREKTDIIVVSDHGFSTISRGVDVAAVLKRAGFKATKKFEDPEPGEVLVIGNGGSVSLYVIDHDPKVISQLVHFFQSSDFAGVIFSRDDSPGTFPMSAVRIGTTNAPDLVVSLRWFHDKSETGAPGTFVAEGGKRGKGSHASLSHYDLNNTGLAAGPDFKKGMVDELPTGNIDIAPTVLWLLGAEAGVKLDGRVLKEALVQFEDANLTTKQETLIAERDTGIFIWSQYLKVSRVENTVYFDEGNGESVVKKLIEQK
jgi:arylsulfatase A-like enzyme